MFSTSSAVKQTSLSGLVTVKAAGAFHMACAALACQASFHFIPYSLGCGASCDSSDILARKHHHFQHGDSMHCVQSETQGLSQTGRRS